VDGKAQELVLPDGGFIYTSPDLTATLTNLSKGKQVTLSITGVFHQTTLANSDVMTEVAGRNLLGDRQASFVLAVEDFSYVFDKKDNFVQPLEGEGQLIDVCGLVS
jgi:hypothetical protein